MKAYAAVNCCVWKWCYFFLKIHCIKRQNAVLCMFIHNRTHNYGVPYSLLMDLKMWCFMFLFSYQQKQTHQEIISLRGCKTRFNLILFILFGSSSPGDHAVRFPFTCYLISWTGDADAFFRPGKHVLLLICEPSSFSWVLQAYCKPRCQALLFFARLWMRETTKKAIYISFN